MKKKIKVTALSCHLHKGYCMTFKLTARGISKTTVGWWDMVPERFLLVAAICMIMVVVYVHDTAHTHACTSHDTGLKPDLINDISFRWLAGWLTCEKSLSVFSYTFHSEVILLSLCKCKNKHNRFFSYHPKEMALKESLIEIFRRNMVTWQFQLHGGRHNVVISREDGNISLFLAYCIENVNLYDTCHLLRWDELQMLCWKSRLSV